jgi:hypothetical protein
MQRKLAPLGIIRYENEDAPTYAWVRTGVTKARRGEQALGEVGS